MSIVHSPGLVGPAVFRCAQAGCRVCQDSLVRQHEGLVHFVLRQYVWGDVAYADLLQVGRLAVWQAVLHFDPERGRAFSTYAVVAIQHRLWRAVRRAQRLVWLYPVPEPVDVRCLAEESVWWGQVEAALLEAVQRLPSRSRRVIVAAYGLDGQPPRRLATLGRAWGMSRELVHYWRNAALVLLRLPTFSGRLRQVVEQDNRTAYARTQALNRAWQQQWRRRR